jgi:hypothetical protein
MATGAGIKRKGAIRLALLPIHRATLLAGLACKMSGLVEMTPEMLDTPSVDGGACVRVGNARTNPPP